MIPYLEKTLNLRRDEFAPASLLFLYLFLMIGCYVMGKSVGDAMFLSAFPTYLPHAIVGTALVVGVFASVYIRISHRLRLEMVVISSLVFFALSFALFWWLTRFQSRWVYPLIFMWVYLVGAMGPTMGWTLANCVLTTREARRLHHRRCGSARLRASGDLAAGDGWFTRAGRGGGAAALPADGAAAGRTRRGADR